MNRLVTPLFGRSPDASLDDPNVTSLRPSPGPSTDPALLRFLIPGQSFAAGANLLGSRGEAVTVTRSGAANSVDPDGLQVALAANKADAAAHWLVAEGPSTNLLTAPDDFTDAAWTAAGTSPVIVTLSSAVPHPTGAGQVSRLVFPSTAAATSFITQSQTVTASVGYSASVYLRTASGVTSINLWLKDGVLYNTVNAKVGPTWTRVVLPNTATTGGRTTLVWSLGIDTGDTANQVGGATRTIYAARAQFELQMGPSSYAATTRNAVSVVLDNPLAVNNPADWVVSVAVQENRWPYAGSPQMLWKFGATQGATNSAYAYVDTGVVYAAIRNGAGTYSQSNLDAPMSGGPHRIAVEALAGVCTIYVDGVAPAQTKSGGATITAHKSTIHLGDDASFPLMGRLRDLAVGLLKADILRAVPPKIICLGDSTVLGAGVASEFSWPSQVQNIKGPDRRVVNAGVSGDTIAQATTRWTNTYASTVAAGDKVVVLCGANDVGLVGTSATAARDLLQTLWAAIASAGATPVYCTILPFGGSTWDANAANGVALNALITAQAVTDGRTCIDLYAAMLSGTASGQINELLAGTDLIHPLTSGQALIGATVAAAV